MAPNRDAREHEITVAERVRPRDVLLFAITLAALAAAPWAMMSAGSDLVTYQNSSGTDSEAPAWMGVLVPPRAAAGVVGDQGVLPARRRAVLQEAGNHRAETARRRRTY